MSQFRYASTDALIRQTPDGTVLDLTVAEWGWYKAGYVSKWLREAKPPLCLFCAGIGRVPHPRNRRTSLECVDCFGRGVEPAN